MQRPADIGSVAARLNNLEQKMDELEPGGGGGDSALAERLFEITVKGAIDFSGVAFPFHESMTVFDTEGTSLSQTVLGIPWEGSPPGAAYWNSFTRPFYYQTFSTDRFTTSTSMEFTLFGNPHPDLGLGDYVAALRTSDTNLSRAVFGSVDMMSHILTSKGSLVNMLLPSDPEDIDEIVGFGQNLAQVLMDEIQNLKSRVAFLEANM